MSLEKHTPGPWRIIYGGQEGDDYAVVGSPHSERAICTLEPRDYQRANAQVIAAAPNLLAELFQVKRWMEDCCMDLAQLDTPGGRRYHAVCAAIAQATEEK